MIFNYYSDLPSLRTITFEYDSFYIINSITITSNQFYSFLYQMFHLKEVFLMYIHHFIFLQMIIFMLIQVTFHSFHHYQNQDTYYESLRNTTLILNRILNIFLNIILVVLLFKLFFFIQTIKRITPTKQIISCTFSDSAHTVPRFLHLIFDDFIRISFIPVIAIMLSRFAYTLSKPVCITLFKSLLYH